MNSMEDKTTLAIREAAADWIVRLAGEGASASDQAEFLSWLQRSSEHVREYLRAETAWFAMEGVARGDSSNVPALLLSPAQNVVALPANLPMTRPEPESSVKQSPAARRRLQRVALACAATLLLALAFVSAPRIAEKLDPNVYSTGIGEQRQILLPDGSTAELNTHSKVRVDLTATTRDIRLIEGEAFFDVAKDPSRPFRVLSDTAVVRAIGTKFNVYRHADRTEVTVIEGRVAVAPGSGDGKLHLVELDAGQRARIGARAPIRPMHADAGRLVAWREKRLIFENDTLADVVAEFNRYNPQQLVIEDAALAAERIDGVFDADKPRVLTGFLTRRGEVSATAMANGTISLTRTEPGGTDR